MFPKAQPSPALSPPADKARELAPPRGVDPALWRVLAEGLPSPLDVDFKKLTASFSNDADISLEFRPSALDRLGLWQPIIAKLPREARSSWQEVLDGLGVDPLSRTDALSLSLRHTDAARKTGRDEFEKVTLFLRTRNGLATDLLRLSSKFDSASNDKDFPGQINVAIFETLSQEERASARSRVVPASAVSDLYEITPEVTLVHIPERNEATLITPHGIVGVKNRERPNEGVAEVVELISRLIRRAQSGQGDTAEESPEVFMVRASFAKVELELHARLGSKLDFDVSVRGVDPKLRAQLAEHWQATSLERILETLKRVAPSTAEAFSKSSRMSVNGDTFRLTLGAPVRALVADVGGVALPGEERGALSALTLGKNLDSGAVLEAAPATSAVRPRDDVSSLSRAGVPFTFGATSGERTRLVRSWLESDGTLHNLAVRVASRFGRAVPVQVAECGTANAFYHPRNGSITLCYELAFDLIEKLRDSFQKEQLGPAVIGTLLWVLIHEYGHALVHQMALPVTGREEDAVDQLATLELIKSGDEGIRYALAAQQWFAAAARLGHSVPNWDEHSPQGVRFYEMSCLIYGSDPEKFSSLAGSQWLPSERARRCPNEYHKVNESWRRILADAGARGTPAPTPTPGPTPTPSPTPRPSAALPCEAQAGTWELTTRVTSALKATAIGVSGYYRMVVGAGCEVSIDKLGFEKTHFAPDRVQRGTGRLRQDGRAQVLDTAFVRDGKVDYTAEFRLEFEGSRLSGGWRYTGSSWQATGFEGAFEGHRR